MKTMRTVWIVKIINMTNNNYEPENDYLSTEFYSEGEPVLKTPKLDDEPLVQNPLFQKMKDLFADCDETTRKLDDEHAKIINDLFAKGLDENKFKDLCKKVLRPANLDKVINVRVNEVIWNKLKFQTQSRDSGLQLCLKRRSCIREEFKQQLSSTNVPVTEYIFGDNVESRIVEIGKSNRITNKATRGRGRDFSYSRWSRL